MLELARYKLFDFLSKKDSLKRFYELEKLQWESREMLLELQSLKLQSLVYHAYSNTIYYRTLFDSLKLTPNDIAKPSDLIYLPILTKSLIKANFEAMKAVKFSSYSPRIKATSGSTGEAFHFVIDRNTHSWVHGYMLLAWAVAGFEFGDKVLRVGGGNLRVKPLYRKILSALKNTIDIAAFDFDERRILEIISIINKDKPGIIYGYSSALAFIAKYALDNSINLYSPKGIVTTAENLLPHNRDRIQSAFDSKVFDQYGVMECGITAFECSNHHGYHIGSTKGIIETVNDEEHPVEDTPGRIIGTDLDNYAFPMLRYDSGDIGTISRRTCSCGRGFEMLESLEGRTREFLTSSSGKKVHGAVFSYLVRENPWISQYQVYQKEVGKLQVRIISGSPLTEARKQNISSFVNAKCGDDMQVDVIAVSDIPLSKNNKRHFVISEISNI